MNAGSVGDEREAIGTMPEASATIGKPLARCRKLRRQTGSHWHDAEGLGDEREAIGTMPEVSATIGKPMARVF